MKRFVILSGLLLASILVFGCTEDSGIPEPAGISCPCCCNNTAIAIGIALNDPAVRAMLGDSYSITGVLHNATVTLPLDGIYTTINTIDVIIDTQGDLLHVYIDTTNCSVVSILPQPKRLPVESPPDAITINPVDDYVVGDVFTVNGTSPLQAGNLLFIEIIPAGFKPAPWEDHPGPRTTISGIVQTVEYDNGVSHYYYAVNTTSLLPNRYGIWVWPNPDDPYWEGVSTEFNLSGGKLE